MPANPTLNLFAPFRCTPAFWDLPLPERRQKIEGWHEALHDALPRVEHYQLYPSRGTLDVLTWAAADASTPEVSNEVFRRFAHATSPYRRWLAPRETLWGLTRPSPYVRKESSTTIDPVHGDRLPYLFVYPFVKTHDWYRLGTEERRRMMGEHIQVGRKFGDVNQLLLYAFGLQDQDFVVVYESHDPARFSELVHALRATEARGYTARDTPVLTALHRPGGELADLFG
jgi:chlorite dismutase